MEAVILQVIPLLFMQINQKTASSFQQIYTKNIMCAKCTALPVTMLKRAFYPIADFTFCCWATLKRCYRNWTHCVSHINTWTVSIHCSSVDSVEELLSRVVMSLTVSKKHYILLKKKQNAQHCEKEILE